jgi:hypothetical protein
MNNHVEMQVEPGVPPRLHPSRAGELSEGMRRLWVG